MTNCQSCGMPMQGPADFGGGKTDNLYCRYCTDASGNLLPKEVVRQNMIQFYTQTVGKTAEEATLEVDKIMATMPAWQVQPGPVAPTEPAQPTSEPVVSPSSEPVASSSEPVQSPPPTSEPLVSESSASPVQPTAEDKPHPPAS